MCKSEISITGLQSVETHFLYRPFQFLMAPGTPWFVASLSLITLNLCISVFMCLCVEVGGGGMEIYVWRDIDRHRHT